MRPKTFMIYAHGRKIHARLVKHELRPGKAELVCWQCGTSATFNFVAEAVQYGFVADMHWDVYNCEKCGVNTCHQYEKLLSLEKQLDRLK